MKRYWLLLGIGLLSVLLAVGAYACGGDDDSEAVDDSIEDILDDDGMVFQLAAELMPQGDSTASGTAELSVNGEGILVSIAMEGLSAGAHPNHLHDGSCAENGNIHVPLDNIVADDSGDGTQTTGSNELPLSHFETDHYLAVHEAEDDLSIVACGDVVTA